MGDGSHGAQGSPVLVRAAVLQVLGLEPGVGEFAERALPQDRHGRPAMRRPQSHQAVPPIRAITAGEADGRHLHARHQLYGAVGDAAVRECEIAHGRPRLDLVPVLAHLTRAPGWGSRRGGVPPLSGRYSKCHHSLS